MFGVKLVLVSTVFWAVLFIYIAGVAGKVPALNFIYLLVYSLSLVFIYLLLYHLNSMTNMQPIRLQGSWMLQLIVYMIF